ncbi:MAG TPA: CBS domain-containing protein [Acidimicrobiales bacterium]|nr:CBS domain-containing protein [Acidimicrobiales bacterium]
MTNNWAGSDASPVRECCDRAPVAVSRDARLREVARRMRDEDISCVLVGDREELISIVTERDLTEALARGLGGDALVTEIATANPVTVSADATIRNAAALMLHYGVRHLVVTDNNRAVGVISARDALATLVRTDTPETFVAMIHQALTSRPDCWWG